MSASATGTRLSPADRSLFAVISHVIGGGDSRHWQALLRDYRPDDATDEFDTLPPDADEGTRERLARRIAPQMLALTGRHPAPPQIIERATSGRNAAAGIVVEALLDLYNPAQLDVLVRIWRSAGLT